VLFLVGGTACSGGGDPPLFERLSPARTGVTFANEVSPTEDLNIVNWPYFYNGAGVAVGDVNGNGRPDLYFTANQGPNRLYLNRGDFRFEEVTAEAGVAGTADWSNGATMADVTGNGRLDLYVSVVDGYAGLRGHNELFVNQGPDANGVSQFEEKAAAYGLDHRGYGVQALFFDYDGDGDLDVYLLRAEGVPARVTPPGAVRTKRSERAGDRLYRNDDSVFVDVTDEAGLYSGPTGAGLGVVASDLDGNGCPDLYVANDFFEHDYLYYNNCDGTFTEAIESATGHVSYSSMGVDAADYNNDGRPDVAVADMLPFQEDILKTTEPSDDRRTYRARRQYGYHHQLDRNTLQLNQGNRRFSEIGLLAGVAATDWSWAPLFADLDNDGRKDLFVTNGIYRRPDDLDYFEYALEEGRLDELKAGDTELYKELRARMPQDPVPNFAFQNDGDLTFSDSTAAWGLDRPGFSNGAAYADLDNDGSLDLVVNNIGAPASIYENRADTLRDHQYLKVALEGAGANTRGLGAKVTVYQPGRTQHLEQMPTRGYQSSVDPRLHVGLGTESVDSVQVTWPDGRTETRGAVAPNQTITLRQVEATAPGSGEDPESEPAAEGPRFTVTSAERIGIDFRHEENRPHPDLQREPLMPRTLSSEGPALAVGDATGNGLDDVYLGGGAGQPGALYVQQAGGRFQRLEETDSLWATHAQREDVDASFFDATGNGELDLYVVSGGNEAEAGSEVLRDRLYLNEGGGQFRWAEGALPAAVATNGGAVAPGDADGDGDTDLFVGSRSVPGRYGAVPESVLLENDGSGQFTDGTEEVASGLRDVGMVADATWATLGGESEGPALVVVGEWMPITVFERERGRLVNRTAERGLDSTQGWWNAVRAADLTGDGAEELVAGNFGLNSRLRAVPETPARLYLSDANGDDRPEPLLTRYNDGQSYLWARRDELIARMPGLEEQFPTYEAFGAARVEDLLSEEQLRGATVREARTFASAVVETGADTAALEPLPTRAQVAPIYGVLARDLVGDGRREVMLGGNFYGVAPEQGHYDASLGTLLWKKKKGGWATVPPSESGLYLEREVRALRRVRRPDGPPLLLVARNDDRPLVMRLQDPAKS